jgi:hypothetical protein
MITGTLWLVGSVGGLLCDRSEPAEGMSKEKISLNPPIPVTRHIKAQVWEVSTSIVDALAQGGNRLDGHDRLAGAQGRG